MTRLLVASCFLLAFIGSVGDARATTDVDLDAGRILTNRLNQERMAAGLVPLRRDARLESLARYHSADMALGGFVSATSPTAGELGARALATARDGQAVAVHVAAGTDLVRLAVSLIDPKLTRAGLAVVEREGRLFVTAVAVADPSAAYTSIHHGASPTRVAFLVAAVRQAVLGRGPRVASTR